MSEKRARSDTVALRSEVLACHVHMSSFGLEDKIVWILECREDKALRALILHFGCSAAGCRSHSGELLEWAIDALNPPVLKTFHNVTSTS